MSKCVFQRSVLHESSTVKEPEDHNRALLSAFQFSQQQGPTHLSTNAPQMTPFGFASNDRVVSRRLNPYPVESHNRYDYSNADNTALQPLGQGRFIPSMPAQQVGASALVSSSSSDANLDALSRQIMLAGMAALGMNTHTLQNQVVLDESNGSHSFPLINLNNIPTVSSMQECSVKSSVPDGSGLLKYRAPEIESFVFDRKTGYRFDQTTGLHYDANTGFYINVALKIFMRWDPLSNTYLRENKCSGPPQNVKAVLNSQLPVPNIQSTPCSAYYFDGTQRLTADGANALLGSHLLSNQIEKFAQDGYAGMQIPADISNSLVGRHGGSFMSAFPQHIRSFDSEGENSRIVPYPESACEISHPKNEYRDESDRDAPKRTNQSRSSSRSRETRRSVSRSRSRSPIHDIRGDQRRSCSKQRRNKTIKKVGLEKSLSKDPRTKSFVKNPLSHPTVGDGHLAGPSHQQSQNAKPRKKKTQSKQGGSAATQNRKISRCFNCGFGGHMKRDCTHSGPGCYNCGSIGHKAFECRKPHSKDYQEFLKNNPVKRPKKNQPTQTKID